MRGAVVGDHRLGQGLKTALLQELTIPLVEAARETIALPSAAAEAPLRQRSYPQFVKYMGSKSKIMDFVLTGINEVHRGGAVCDLFAGSASLAGAIGDQSPIVSNDIQKYSRVLSGAYLTSWRSPSSPSAASIVERAREIVEANIREVGPLHDYNKTIPLSRFQKVEEKERRFFDYDLDRPWHLFFKCYSGTWWSAKQALWIDAIRQVAEEHRSDPCYDAVIASLMFAMAYASQGTGHYAQYRVANTDSSMRDISIYRRRAVEELFAKKYEAVLDGLATEPTLLQHRITSLDYQECLAQFEGGTVYADPPYAFVHYSRFYHALETLVLYDYPDIQQIKGETVKGRYREGRHQSPFCIRTQVPDAFRAMFRGVSASGSNLVLSYSNTGMISLDDLGAIAAEEFKGRSIEVLSTDYKHMTLGRQFDRDRTVEECLMLVK